MDALFDFIGLLIVAGLILIAYISICSIIGQTISTKELDELDRILREADND